MSTATRVDDALSALRYIRERYGELDGVGWGRLAPVLDGDGGTPSGVTLIAAERQRQVTEEVWTPEHDDTHQLGEMARAAAAYALPPDIGTYRVWREDLWPWEANWWKPGDRVRELVKAGALIAAEIDRLQRERDDGTETPDGP